MGARGAGLALAATLLVIAGEASAQVIVRVEDAQGRPVPGADGQLGALGASTGLDGILTFSAVPPGTHALSIRAIGYRSESREVMITGPGPVRLTVTLERIPVLLPPVVVEATRPGVFGVVSTARLDPLERAEVHLLGRRGRTLRTDSLGRFAHPEAEGPYLVRVSARGYEDVRLSVAVPEEGGRELLVQLSEARPGYQGAGNRERWMLRELGFRLAWSNPLQVLTREELARYGLRSICEVPQLAPAIRLMESQGASAVIDGDFSVPNPCAIRAHQVQLVEWGMNSCASTAMGVAQLFRTSARRMGEASGRAGVVQRRTLRCPPYLLVWLSR